MKNKTTKAITAFKHKVLRLIGKHLITGADPSELIAIEASLRALLQYVTRVQSLFEGKEVITDGKERIEG